MEKEVQESDFLSPKFQGIGSWMYPGPNVGPRHGQSLYNPYSSQVFMGYINNPQEWAPREDQLNTVGTLVLVP